MTVYELACTFAASRELLRLGRKHHGLKQITSTFQLSTAAQRLIAIASMTRSALDTWPSAVLAGRDAGVGVLVPNIEHPGKRKALGFREACNKLLHADHIDLGDRKCDEILSYTVTLMGQWKGESWRAALNVVRFLEEASRVA